MNTQPARSMIEDPVDRVRALRPLLARHAADCEAEGRIAQPVIDALRAEGLFLLSASRRAGGGGSSLKTCVDTIAEIGKSCPSTAWSFGILSGTTSMCWSMPALRLQLFPTGDELCCFVVARTGVGIRVEGGWLVSGEWAYASGCMHARWALCGVALQDGRGNPVDGGMAFIDLERTDEVTIEIDWHVAGLSGTGSNRIKATGHFVPDSLILWLDSAKGAAAIDLNRPDVEPRDLWPPELTNGLTLVPAMLGAAEGILDALQAKMDGRPIANWNYARQTESHLLLAMLGEAAQKIDSARMHIHRACAMADVTAQTRALSQLEKAQAQADCGYAMRLVRDAGNSLMEIAGPAAFALSSPIQRLWRDLNVGSRHNTVNAGLSLELYGRFLTGQPSNMKMIPAEQTSG